MVKNYSKITFTINLISIKIDFENEFGNAKSDIFENVYVKPHANVCLASFMKLDITYMNMIVTNMIQNMNEFIKIHVVVFLSKISLKHIS